jgi:hypothetical protein
VARFPRNAALLLSLLVGACATPPDVAPLLDLSTARCALKIERSNAVGTVPTIAGDDEKPSIVTLDLRSPCVEDASGKSLYALFYLPDGGPYTVSVSSVPLGRSVFAPRAAILDAQGAELRRLPTSSFLFRGSNLTALFRSHDGDRYLLVTSDLSSVGKPLRRSQESVQIYTTSSGFTIHTGTDVLSESTWSLNGQVAVSVVGDKPKAK